MYKAYNLKRDRDFEEEMAKVSWQTSLIMNSSGKYKKWIKPTDLYKSAGDKKEDNDSHKSSDTKKSKEELRQEIKERFQIS